jgi:hypothetical protein
MGRFINGPALARKAAVSSHFSRSSYGNKLPRAVTRKMKE